MYIGALLTIARLIKEKRNGGGGSRRKTWERYTQNEQDSRMFQNLNVECFKECQMLLKGQIRYKPKSI